MGLEPTWLLFTALSLRPLSYSAQAEEAKSFQVLFLFVTKGTDARVKLILHTNLTIEEGRVPTPCNIVDISLRPLPYKIVDISQNRSSVIPARLFPMCQYDIRNDMLVPRQYYNEI